MRTRRLPGHGVLLLASLAAAACGEPATPAPPPDAPLPALSSSPSGEAVAVAWRGVVGERYTATLSAEQVLEQHPADGPTTAESRTARWQLVEETLAVDGRDRPLRARLVVTYREDADDAAAEPSVAMIDRSSRRHPYVMWTSGSDPLVGTAAGRLDAAGLGGSAPWIHGPSVRLGEAWTLADVAGPAQDVPAGWAPPEEGPWTEGRFHVTAIEGRGADTVIVVAMTTRTRLVRTDPEDEAGPMHLTEDVVGEARIAAATGRPLALEITTTKRTAQAGHEVVEHGRLVGTVDRTPPEDAR